MMYTTWVNWDTVMHVCTYVWGELINFGFHFYAGVYLGVLVVGILAILLAFLMLRHYSNNGTVADFKGPPKHGWSAMR